MLLKDKPIYNEPLLKKYIAKRCIVTGLVYDPWTGIATHAHHRVRRSKLRLDHQQNLVPLIDTVNTTLECGYDAFFKLWLSLRVAGSINLKLRNMGAPKLYALLTDQDGSVYEKLRHKGTDIQRKKKPTKIKAQPLPCGKSSKYKKKLNGKVVLR